MYFPTYCSPPSSSSAVVRACRHRVASTLSSGAAPSCSLPSRVFAREPPCRVGCRSVSISGALRLAARSTPTRWSHGVVWRSPVSLRAQIRAASPVLERSRRRIATMGMIVFFFFFVCWIFVS